MSKSQDPAVDDDALAAIASSLPMSFFAAVTKVAVEVAVVVEVLMVMVLVFEVLMVVVPSANKNRRTRVSAK